MKEEKKYTVIWRNEVLSSSKANAVQTCLDMIREQKTAFEVVRGFRSLKQLSKLEPLQIIEL